MQVLSKNKKKGLIHELDSDHWKHVWDINIISIQLITSLDIQCEIHDRTNDEVSVPVLLDMSSMVSNLRKWKHSWTILLLSISIGPLIPRMSWFKSWTRQYTGLFIRSLCWWWCFGGFGPDKMSKISSASILTSLIFDFDNCEKMNNYFDPNSSKPGN